MTQLLAIETATQACSASLHLSDGTCLSRFSVAPRQHSALILGYVDALLSEAGIALRDLDAMAFGCGPGSFMGLRLAASVIQGLAFAAEKPVVPISSLRALAQVGADALNVETVLGGWDARMKEVYWGVYQRNAEGLMEAVHAESLSAPQDISAAVLKAAAVPLDAVGNAWVEYGPSLTDAVREVVRVADTLYYPTAAAVAQLAVPEVRAGRVIAPDAVQPHYLRDRVTHSVK